jgi:hypothetical protein
MRPASGPGYCFESCSERKINSTAVVYPPMSCDADQSTHTSHEPHFQRRIVALLVQAVDLVRLQNGFDCRSFEYLDATACPGSLGSAAPWPGG